MIIRQHLKKQWIALLGGDLILIPLDGNHRLTVMSSYFYEMSFADKAVDEHVFNSEMHLSNISPAWTQSPVECIEYRIIGSNTNLEGAVSNEFRDKCNMISKMIETDSLAKNSTAFKSMLIALTETYEKRINSASVRFKEFGNQEGMKEPYLDNLYKKTEGIAFCHRKQISTMIWEEFNKNGTYGIVLLTDFLATRKALDINQIEKDFKAKSHMNSGACFCRSGRTSHKGPKGRFNRKVPLAMEVTAECLVNTLITVNSAKRIRTFYCGTPSNIKQKKFNSGQLHDVTSLQWTQLMVYYSNRYISVLFDQPSTKEVKAWKYTKASLKIKTYVVHNFYMLIMSILTKYGPNPELPQTTIDGCRGVSEFIVSDTDHNVPFIHAYMNMYIKYLAGFMNTQREHTEFTVDELKNTYHDLFPAMGNFMLSGVYEERTLKTLDINETYNIELILKDKILNECYDWENDQSRNLHRFDWNSSLDFDPFFSIPFPDSLIIPKAPKQLLGKSTHDKDDDDVHEQDTSVKKTFREKQQQYSSNLVCHISKIHSEITKVRSNLLTLPSTCSAVALEDFKKQATNEIQRILLTKMPTKPAPKVNTRKKKKRKKDEIAADSDDSDEGDY